MAKYTAGQHPPTRLGDLVLTNALQFVKHVGALISASKRWIRPAKLDRLFPKKQAVISFGGVRKEYE